MTSRSSRRPVVAAVCAALILGAVTVSVATAAPPTRPVPRIVAVGDVACQSYSQSDGEGACRSDEVAALVTSLAPDRFLALGDLQYNKGTLDEFQRVWDQQFGHLKPITDPVAGNHEYDTPGAQGYYDYFGAAAHGPEGYYSFDLGTWHLVALNSDICGDPPGCGPGTPQYEWLAADLRANDDAECTLAFQHHPVFDWRQWEKWVDPDSTNPNGGSEVEHLRDLWALMDGAGVDVMLVGHNHIYHRWAPQDVNGTRDANGIRQFTIGTGGRSLYPLGKKPRPANLLAVQNKAFGVLEMNLRDGSYDYRWVGLPTDPAFRDAGSFDCR
ncbi:MAG TPA: metallophosphoesterase [Actinomycetota bacterium]